MVLISKACTGWCWSTHVCKEHNWYPLQSSNLQLNSEFTETCPLVSCFAAILSFKTGMAATLLSYMCQGVLQSLQWCSNVGCKRRVSPVAFQCGAISTKFFPVVFQCTLQVFAWSPSGIPVYNGSASGIPVYTGPASVHQPRVRDVNKGGPEDCVLPFFMGRYSLVSNGRAWTSCQICKIAGCACAGNAGKVFPTAAV